MKNLSLFLGAAGIALIASSQYVSAQDTNITSGSDSTAVSGSQSGSQSASNQNQTQNNAGIGNSESWSGSASEANANTASSAESNGNLQGQDQGQSQTANGGASDQGQMQSSSNTLANQQGVTVGTTFNTYNRKKTVQEFRTNAAVPLAASSSFSSDYCGGTASGGASIAPIGVSIGGAAPTFDKSCQYLRLAEKAGMLGANYHNMQQPDMSLKAMSLMTWATCMAGPQNDRRRRGTEENITMQACLALGLLGSDISPVSPPPRPVPEPQVQQYNGQPTPEAVERYKTPRGELEYRSNPVIQEVPIAMATAVSPAP